MVYQRKVPHDCPGRHQTQKAIRTNTSVDAGSVPKTSEVRVTLISTVLARAGSLSHLVVQRALRAPAMKHGFLWLLKWQHNSSAVSSASPLEHVRQQVSSYDLKIRMKYLINLKSILLGCLSGCKKNPSKPPLCCFKSLTSEKPVDKLYFSYVNCCYQRKCPQSQDLLFFVFYLCSKFH